MRNSKIQFGLLALLVLPLSLRATDNVVTHTWTFSSSASPAFSDSGAGTATITTGRFSSGWLENLPALTGGAGGYWDLGQSGSISLNFPNGLVNNGTIKSVTVKVTQWWDGAIYNDYVSVAVPGAHSSTINTSFAHPGAVGGWVIDETSWTPNSGATVRNIQLSGGSNGSVVDEVTVEVVVLTQPPTLSIEPLARGQVRISWPIEFKNMVLEVSSDLADPKGWSRVDSAVEVDSTTCSVVAAATAPSRFYRLKQPDL